MDLIILILLVLTAISAIYMKDLLSVTIVLGAYSLIMAIIWMRLNAVDVAFTEASVGAGITTVLILAALSRTSRYEGGKKPGASSTKKRGRSMHHFIGFLACVAITGMLIYGTLDLPDYGDPEAPANTHVAHRYITEAHHETGSKNFVTAILASYRGYDTLGETTVIFTAGISLILLLRRRKKK